jgi:hypothetical protein
LDSIGIPILVQGIGIKISKVSGIGIELEFRPLELECNWN